MNDRAERLTLQLQELKASFLSGFEAPGHQAAVEHCDLVLITAGKRTCALKVAELGERQIRGMFFERLDKDGHTVFKSSYGRFHGKLATLMFSGKAPGGAVTFVREINPATGQYTTPVSVTDPKVNFGVDDGLNNQYTDHSDR